MIFNYFFSFCNPYNSFCCSILYFLNLCRKVPHSSTAEVGRIYPSVAVHHENVPFFWAYHILIVEVAQIDFGSGKSPISRIDEFETNVLGERGDFFIQHLRTLDIGLLNDDMKSAIMEVAKSNHRQPRFWKDRIED